MHESDFGVRSWEVERDDVVEYIRQEAKKMEADGQSVHAYVALTLAQDIELGLHTRMYK